MRVTLGAICTVRSSLVDPTRPEFASLPHIAPDSIEKASGRLLAYRTAGEDGVTSGKYRFQSGDVLYSKIRPNLNKVAIADFAGLCSADMYALDVDRQQAAPEYIAYLLRGQEFLDYATSLSNRANIPKLNRGQLLSYGVQLPSLSEQRRIAAILDRADATRAKRRQVLSHLDALAQAIFSDMFPVNHSFHAAPLSHLIKWSSGRFLPATAQNGGAYPVYGGNGVNGSHDEFMFDEPRLVVGRVGAYCGAVHLTQPQSWVTDNALVATLLRGDLILPYLLPALRQANLNQFASVSGQPSISGNKIGAVRLPVPPAALQSEFARRIRLVESQREATQKANSIDSELFFSLESRAFRGEL